MAAFAGESSSSSGGPNNSPNYSITHYKPEHENSAEEGPIVKESLAYSWKSVGFLGRLHHKTKCGQPFREDLAGEPKLTSKAFPGTWRFSASRLPPSQPLTIRAVYTKVGGFMMESFEVAVFLVHDGNLAWTGVQRSGVVDLAQAVDFNSSDQTVSSHSLTYAMEWVVDNETLAKLLCKFFYNSDLSFHIRVNGTCSAFME